jgi:hypothetical protein
MSLVPPREADDGVGEAGFGAGGAALPACSCFEINQYHAIWHAQSATCFSYLAYGILLECHTPSAVCDLASVLS